MTSDVDLDNLASTAAVTHAGIRVPVAVLTVTITTRAGDLNGGFHTPTTFGIQVVQPVWCTIAGMDYGDRQERALFILKCCRAYPDQTGVVYRDHQKRAYTVKDIAEAVEKQTDLGVSLVAMTGLISSALFEMKTKQKV